MPIVKPMPNDKGMVKYPLRPKKMNCATDALANEKNKNVPNVSAKNSFFI